MEHTIVTENVEGKAYYYLDITEEFVKRFGSIYAPIEKVYSLLGDEESKEILDEMCEWQKGIFEWPDYIAFKDEDVRCLTYYNNGCPSMQVEVMFKDSTEVLVISEDTMFVGNQLDTEDSTGGDELQEDAEEQDVRKVAFTYGMTGDHMLILTDAPKNAIEDWIREYLKGLEDNKNVYFKPLLQKDYYVKVIADSEVNDLSWDDIEVIGFDESYDLGDYSVDEN